MSSSRKDVFYFRVHDNGLEPVEYKDVQPGDTVIQLRRDLRLQMEHPEAVRMRRWDKLDASTHGRLERL